MSIELKNWLKAARKLQAGVFLNGNIIAIIVKPKKSQTRTLISFFEKTKKGVGVRHIAEIFGRQPTYEETRYIEYCSAYETDRKGQERKVYDDFSNIEVEKLPSQERQWGGGYRLGEEVLARNLFNSIKI